MLFKETFQQLWKSPEIIDPWKGWASILLSILLIWCSNKCVILSPTTQCCQSQQACIHTDKWWSVVLSSWCKTMAIMYYWNNTISFPIGEQPRANPQGGLKLCWLNNKAHEEYIKNHANVHCLQASKTPLSVFSTATASLDTILNHRQNCWQWYAFLCFYCSQVWWVEFLVCIVNCCI